MASHDTVYTLMHEDIPVARVALSPVTGVFTSLSDIWHREHLPTGVAGRSHLNDWWRDRSIPGYRQGLSNALITLEVRIPEFKPQLLKEASLGLSLSDSYWIRPEGCSLSWEQIRFRGHTFPPDLGAILFHEPIPAGRPNLFSPDAVTDGWLMKRWRILDGQLVLQKAGGDMLQEPYCELMAHRIMERLHIPHVPYRVMIENGQPYSLCENLLAPEEELVPAYRILFTEKKANHLSLYQHYVNCCGKLGVLDITDSLNQMLTLDYLIANEDRHLNNFGLIRNAHTLQYTKTAPIYDSGSSLWFNWSAGAISGTARTICKPFRSSHSEQIRLVTSFDWLELDALAGIDEEFREILADAPFISERRRDLLCRALKTRLDLLTDYVESVSAPSLPGGIPEAPDRGDGADLGLSENTAYHGHT